MCSLSPPLFPLLFFPVPVFYFGNTDYHVDESDGFVEVQVWRTGTDLSKGGTVTVRSRKTDPVSAEGTWKHQVSWEWRVTRRLKQTSARHFSVYLSWRIQGKVNAEYLGRMNRGM